MAILGLFWLAGFALTFVLFTAYATKSATKRLDTSDMLAVLLLAIVWPITWLAVVGMFIGETMKGASK